MAKPLPQFPSLESAQRAGGRNKVALKPGHSLMDWIRLTHASTDLAGTGGKILEVTPEELKKHNKKDDAWICLKGKVYNVTAYMNFHPGGDDELMKGVGRDATDLFNEIHQWVNYESMLQKCFVGRLQMPSIYLRRGETSLLCSFSLFEECVFVSSLSFALGSSGSLKFLLGNEGSQAAKDGNQQLNGSVAGQDAKPRFDWFQTESTVSLVLFTRWKEASKEHVIVDVSGKEFRCSVRIHRYTYLMHLDLEAPVQPECEVKVGKRGSGAIEVVLQKERKGSPWCSVGTPLPGNASFTKETAPFRRPARLASRHPLTHDTHLFTFQLPPGTKMWVPLGHHVCLTANVDGVDVSRSYTPVCPSLTAGDADGRQLHLMIKIYPKGALTPTIEQMDIGSSIEVSDHLGDFTESRLLQCRRLVLLAAGTGFTPMCRLIQHALLRSAKVRLMFFNKQERDILWKEQLDALAEQHADRFFVRHVLSSPSDDWKGDRGRVRLQLLKAFVPAEEGGEGDLLVCVCGPTPFTKLTLAYLEELGYSPESVHAFASV